MSKHKVYICVGGGGGKLFKVSVRGQRVAKVKIILKKRVKPNSERKIDLVFCRNK